MLERYPNLVPQGISAELIAEKWNISREDNDRVLGRVPPAGRARPPPKGRFDREIVPIDVTTDDGKETMRTDEGIRPDSSMETLAKLKPAFKPDGVITAGELVADHRRRGRACSS